MHNAPAGYWAIATGCRLPSTSLSAGAASFAAGLLEAVTQTLCERHPVLLVAYDWPPPSSLEPRQTTASPFGAALAVNHRQTGDSLATLKVSLTEYTLSNCNNSYIYQTLYSDNPTLEALPLLERIAAGVAASCLLPYLNERGVLVEYAPC